MTGTTALERILLQDRLLIATSLLVVSGLAWFYLVDMATAMPGMSVSLATLASTGIAEWDRSYFLMILTMWVVMMIGMMLPTAAPTVLIFSRIARQAPDARLPILRSYLFAIGYLLAWAVFSLAATFLQWAIEAQAFGSSFMNTHAPAMGAGLLIVAGLYQWTPFKAACLNNCRGPLEFLSRSWRRSTLGALRMGVEHGLYCLGCCWMLMLLLFVGGVMNLLWVATITILVLGEKLLPAGIAAGRIAGVVLVLAGVVLLLR